MWNHKYDRLCVPQDHFPEVIYDPSPFGIVIHDAYACGRCIRSMIVTLPFILLDNLGMNLLRLLDCDSVYSV